MIRIQPIDPATPDHTVLSRAASLLRRGQLVAFPTETVYGLGANALDPSAVRRIYDVKGRPEYNPLIVHVADGAAARRLVTAWPDAAERLTRRWWPGPLTIVLPKSREIPVEVTAGLGTVALRIPAHPVALALLQVCGFPLAAPSANRSGAVSPTTAEHVAAGLGDGVPMILDGGATGVGIESTVVDLSGNYPVLLRPGMISRAELEQEIGPVGLPGPAPDASTPRASPGMLDRHYAPRARVVMLQIDGAAPPGVVNAGVIAALMRTLTPPSAAVEVLTLPQDPAGYARALYSSLHQLDATGAAVILVEPLPDTPEWDGLRDRLARAAQP